MYLLPQEIEVWYIIPALRKEFAKVLIKKHKLSYEKAGEMLGISKAAVSQYLANKRANKIVLSDKIKKEIEKSVEIIFKDSKKTIQEIERVLKLLKQKKFSCDVCRKYNKDIIKYCGCNPSYSQ